MLLLNLDFALRHPRLCLTSSKGSKSSMIKLDAPGSKGHRMIRFEQIDDVFCPKGEGFDLIHWLSLLFFWCATGLRDQAYHSLPTRTLSHWRSVKGSRSRIEELAEFFPYQSIVAACLALLGL